MQNTAWQPFTVKNQPFLTAHSAEYQILNILKLLLIFLTAHSAEYVGEMATDMGAIFLTAHSAEYVL